MAFHMLAAMNETALDEMERKAQASVQTRRKRGDAIGQRRYGEVRMLKDGRVVGRNERPKTVIAAFREAGSYFGAARLLNERGVPTRSGRRWYPRTVQRIVNDNDPTTVPMGQRRGVRAFGSRLFSGLLRCHCGATMGQTTSHWSPKYRCSAGASDPAHPRPYMVSEARLLDAIKTEAGRLAIPADAFAEDADMAARKALEARRQRVIDNYEDGLIDRAARDAKFEAIVRELDRLDARSRTIAIPAIDWDGWTPQAINEVLRAMFGRIDLDPDLMPAEYHWRVGEWRAA
jgi:hypothetical protein